MPAPPKATSTCFNTLKSELNTLINATVVYVDNTIVVLTPFANSAMISSPTTSLTINTGIVTDSPSAPPAITIGAPS